MKLVHCMNESPVEEKMIESLRLKTYLFLRALMNNAVPEHERSRESIVKRSLKIQMCFIKILCCIAWNTRNDLSRKIQWKSTVCVSYVKMQRKYSSACILCPKMDGRRLVNTVDEASLNSISHFNSNHAMDRTAMSEALRRQNRLDGDCEISLPEFLTQIQKTISERSKLVSLLDLTRSHDAPQRN